MGNKLGLNFIDPGAMLLVKNESVVTRYWLRWSTTVTAKELTSRQKEKPHGKKKNLTAKKEKPRGKKKNLTAKRKTSRQKEKSHGKKKRLTAKRKTSRQKGKPHSKTKNLAAKRKRLPAKRKTSRQNFFGAERKSVLILLFLLP